MSISGYVQRFSPRAWFYFKSLRYKYYNGEPEIWLIRRLVTRGKLAIDVGASIGLFSREMARGAARVIAFEANPRIAELARMVAPSNVEVKNVAVSSADGEITLRIPINARGNTIDDLATVEPRNVLQSDAIKTEKVPTKQLDEYGYSNCQFIKIDVEGHEESVLEGAMDLIRTQRPVLMIELQERFNPGIFERVIGRLSALHYSPYRLSGRVLLPLDSLCTNGKPSIHAANVVFMPEGLRLPSVSYGVCVASSVRSIIGFCRRLF